MVLFEFVLMLVIVCVKWFGVVLNLNSLYNVDSMGEDIDIFWIIVE